MRWVLIPFIVDQDCENARICTLDDAFLNVHLVAPSVKLNQNFPAALLMHGSTDSANVCLLHSYTSPTRLRIVFITESSRRFSIALC